MQQALRQDRLLGYDPGAVGQDTDHEELLGSQDVVLDTAAGPLKRLVRGNA